MLSGGAHEPRPQPYRPHRLHAVRRADVGRVMHPTDTLLSLSQARIARAASEGHRKATQPTGLTDRQHLARLAQSDPIANRHSLGAAILRLRTLAEAEGSLAREIDAL